MGRRATAGLLARLRAWSANSRVRLLTMVVWIIINGILLWRTFIYYKMSPKFFYLHSLLGSSLCISRATANIINLNLGVLLLPVCRCVTSYFRNPARRFSVQTVRIVVDNCKGFHQFCSWLVVVASAVHFVGHCFNAYRYSQCYSTTFVQLNAAQYPGENPLMIVLRSFPGVTGLVLTVILLLIVVTATRQIRQCNYNLFWYSHKLFILFYIITLGHAFRGILKEQTNTDRHTPGCIQFNSSSVNSVVVLLDQSQWKCDEEPEFDAIGSSSWMWIIGPLILYIIDSMYRLLTSRVKPVEFIDVQLHSSQILQLHLLKHSFNCLPGQFVFVQCPAISSFEWHPLSISRCPTKDDASFTVHVRCSTGDWTVRLRQYFTNSYLNTETQLNSCRLYVDGPYGSPMQEVLEYRTAVCIAGGIGITPFIALLQHIRKNTMSNYKTRRLYLLWVTRDVDMCHVFNDVISDVHRQLWNANRPDVLHVQLYITGYHEDKQVLQRLESLKCSFLANRVLLGRPQWQQVLDSVANTHRRQTVGVFSCGPRTLNRDVEHSCSVMSPHRTVFKFFHESL